MRKQNRKPMPQPSMTVDRLLQPLVNVTDYNVSLNSIKIYLEENARVNWMRSANERDQDFSNIVDFVVRLYNDAHEKNVATDRIYTLVIEIAISTRNRELGLKAFNDAQSRGCLNSYAICAASRMATGFTDFNLARQILNEMQKLLQQEPENLFLIKEINSIRILLNTQPPPPPYSYRQSFFPPVLPTPQQPVTHGQRESLQPLQQPQEFSGERRNGELQKNARSARSVLSPLTRAFLGWEEGNRSAGNFRNTPQPQTTSAPAAVSGQENPPESEPKSC